MEIVENKPPVLHILVLGFHHKLGCQVEFSYPPLIEGTSGTNECPSGWKYLPTLALPDGSHNFQEDTVFFNLQSLVDPTESVYGISCYRQIPVEKLKIRTADVTRSTVQKSVCVLTRLPIYGYIEVKLSLIADAFFDQGDFSCTSILVKAYNQLNACLQDDESRRPSLRHFYVGLSLREIILNWRHKTLILLKLFLLQRRVICFGSPVRGMCTLILGISSLVPRLLEKGFQEVACVRTSRPLSPLPDFTDSIQRDTSAAILEEREQREKLKTMTSYSNEKSSGGDTLHSPDESIKEEAEEQGGEEERANVAQGDNVEVRPKEITRLDSTESATALNADAQGKRLEHTHSLSREGSVDTLVSILGALSSVNPDLYRAPISIFTSGNLCLPYLSLPYMDLLTDPSVLSYVIGTSNVLFQQKRQIADVLVDIENTNLEVHDTELRRQITLSTEDLRMMDYIIKNIQAPKEDAEGSEHWIRDQFQGYLLSLLRTAVSSDTSAKDIDHFNAHFMQAFKRTQCFQEWYDVKPEDEFFSQLPAGHPFSGTLSVADVKLKIAQTMQNSESGRKINQAVNNTSRAVGGAISQAKGAFSNWWSSITTAPTQNAISANGSNAESSDCTTPGAISVTFQNNKSENEIEIHMDEGSNGGKKPPQKKISNVSSSSSSNETGGKFTDSAEELEEDPMNASTSATSAMVNDNKPPSDAEEAIQNLQDVKSSIEPQQQQQQLIQKPSGIVEIGREADSLDKNNLRNLNSAENAVAFDEPDSSGIFIV